MPHSSNYRVFFYRTPAGSEPVREWLQGLDKSDRFRLGQLIQLLQWNGPRLSLPYSRSLGEGLFELRERSNRVRYRVFYAFDGDRIVVLLHAATKDQRTIQDDIRLARRRMAAYFERD